MVSGDLIDMIVFLSIVVLSYLLGSLSFSYIIAKKVKKVDIREHGSGNAGATNTLRVLGIGPAVTVLLLDVLKGVIAVWIGLLIFAPNPTLAAAACGLAAIIGHNWPIFYGFRGGKGVATTIGVLATVSFLPSLIAGIITIISILILKYVSLGSILFMVFTPIFIYVFTGGASTYFYLACIVAVLSIWRHRTNVQRLLNGTENKIGQKKN